MKRLMDKRRCRAYHCGHLRHRDRTLAPRMLQRGRLVEDCRPPVRRTTVPPLDTHDPHLVDSLRRASLERAQQDQRLADIFGTQTVPKVTEETLVIYLDYLKQ